MVIIMNSSRVKKFIVSFCIVIGFVLISMILTKNSMDFYEEMAKPSIAPPAILFPIVWSILYTILAFTIYRFYEEKEIMKWLIINLAINIIWPILFFRFEMLFVSVIWLVLIIISLIITLLKIYKVDKKYAYFNLPYLLWLFFALYLNISVYILNR